MTDRDATSYEDDKRLNLLTPRELAWEFLRRNENYRREFSDSKYLSASALESRARRWRLQKPS